MVTPLSTAQQLNAFNALVGKRFVQAPFKLRFTNDSMLRLADGSMLNLFQKLISFNTSTVIRGLTTTGVIFSGKDLLLIDCPRLGFISASRDVILIRCHNHAGVFAGRNIHCYDSLSYNTRSQSLVIYTMDTPKYLYKNGEAGEITTFAETVSLVNFVVKGSINFVNSEGVPFRGRVIMDKQSRVEDLEHTNAEIIRLEDSADNKDKEKTEKAPTSGAEPPQRSLSTRKRKFPAK